MNSFEANKVFGALLGTVFVLFGSSLLADGIFNSEAPEQPGFAIVAAEPTAGAAAAPAAAGVTPVGQIMQNASAEAGADIFKRCQACHSGVKDGPNKVGPDLWGIVNRPIASHEGFSYSAAMTEFSQDKTVLWDWDHLNKFLHGPKQYIKGTAMGFAGLPKDQERADLLAYLASLSDSPPAFPAPDAGATQASAEGAAAPAGDAAAAPATAPATGTDPSAVPGDAVSQPQGGGTTDAATGAAPTAPAGAVPATGSNATSAPAAAPTPPAAPGETAPAAPAQPNAAPVPAQ